MKPITRDIQLTLLIKCVLLIVLWVVCFKGAQKNTIDLPQWLYGAHPVIPMGQATVSPHPVRH